MEVGVLDIWTIKQRFFFHFHYPLFEYSWEDQIKIFKLYLFKQLRRIK